MDTFPIGSAVRVPSEDTGGMISATVTGYLSDLVGVRADGDLDLVCYLPAEMVEPDHAAVS